MTDGNRLDKRPHIVATLWGLSVLAGTCAMTRYQLTPGRAATPPLQSKTPNHSTRAELLVFLHPQCECSLATVHELSELLAKAGDRCDTSIYFYKPSSEPDTWATNGRLWDAAKSISGAHLLIDSDAQQAKLYGAHCSGQVLVYSSKGGSLVFSGGLTESRGHDGAGQGEEAILKFVRTGNTPVSKTNVYGCAIW